jgi:pyruvate-formate lyase-activating enzyme
LENTRRLDLLPYHGMGVSKKRRLAPADTSPGFEQPAREEVEAAARVLSSHGLEVRIGG